MAVILITGASGLLGAHLARDYAPEHDVSGVFHEHRVPLRDVKMIGADLSQRRLARMVVAKVQPEIIVHCAAATDVDRCQREEDWALRLNRDMAEFVATAAAEHGSALVHISTDAVFDGKEGGYSEEHEPRPINVYGRTKLAGEEAVAEAHPEALIIRTNLFGWHLRADRRSLAEWFLDRLKGGATAPGFSDVFFSPILVNDLGPLLLRLVADRATGLFHLGGRDCVSKFEFGRRLATSFGYAPELVQESTIEAADLAAPRSKRLCLDCRKVEGRLKEPVPALAGGIARLTHQAPAAAWRRQAV